jgi:hypothetical protein
MSAAVRPWRHSRSSRGTSISGFRPTRELTRHPRGSGRGTLWGVGICAEMPMTPDGFRCPSLSEAAPKYRPMTAPVRPVLH